MNGEVVAETYEKSLELLRSLGTEYGFYASRENVANYRRVWARDSVVVGLAALASKDEALAETFLASLRTLKEKQDETGRIPSNVDREEGSVSYGTTVGRIDATLWFVVGVCQFALHMSRSDITKEFENALQKAVFYLSCLELNGRGLLYIPHGADWADEYLNHGYVLYDELLYLLALESYVKVYDDTRTREKAERLRNMICVNYFPSAEDARSEFVYHERLFANILKNYEPPLPVAYFTNHSVRYHTDNLANALLLHSKLCDPPHHEEIIQKIERDFLTEPRSILSAFSPVITPEDKNWEHLEMNVLFDFKNKPYEYHNGGLWPMVHGFFLSSIKDREESKGYLEGFAEVLKKDEFAFPEFYNGKTQEKGGTFGLGFSAAGFVLAHQAVQEGMQIFL